MTPEVNAIYSYTNGFGFTHTIRVVRFNEKGVVYNQLREDAEWGQIELKMKLNIFSIYKKIS
jgi:hypothetical protein